MNKDVLEKYLFEKAFEEAVLFLELHSTVSVTYNGYDVDFYRDNLSPSDKQQIIDIANALKTSYDMSLVEKKRKKPHVRCRNTIFKSKRFVKKFQI